MSGRFLVHLRAGYTHEIKCQVPAELYGRVSRAAKARGMTLTAFCRRALHDSTLDPNPAAYFYVRYPNGDTYPRLSEAGYEFVENAQRYAARIPGAKVIRAPYGAPHGDPRPPADAPTP